MPASTVFTLNDGATTPENFSLPNMGLHDPIGAPVWPTPDYYQRPEDLVEGQKLTIRLNTEHLMYGQVFGYVAPKGQCILDLNPNECWLVPPSPTGYDFAHQGITMLSNGSELKTANIGGGAGHAGTDLGWQQVPFYYENTSSQMASVRYGEDHYGIYAVGAAVATLTLAQAQELLRSATSGDWRWVDELNAWDFMGSCLVNLPAFPVYDKTRMVRAASAKVLEPQRAMLVTFSGTRIERAPVASNDNEHKACTCGGTTRRAAAETDIPAFTADDVKSMIDSAVSTAIEANNAAWETKLTESLTPINARLNDFEPIVLSVLDGKA